MKGKLGSLLKITLIFLFGYSLTVGNTQFSLAASLNSLSQNLTKSTLIAEAKKINNYTSLPQLEGKATVEMIVNGAKIIIEVDGNDAPITAGNFVDLVNRGVYNGLAFHRVVKTPQPFVAQGGDPQGKDPKFPVERLGTGGFIDPQTNRERYIPLEIKPTNAESPIYSQTLPQARVSQPPVLRHQRGAIAMARSQAPDSASSQFYFALDDLDFLDGNYAVFGYVTEGMDVVDNIKQGDRIESAKVVKGIENLKS